MIFENFFKFSKRRRVILLPPIWTIMVAAKLDHSRVLVTKFHQNRSTLKGRSAGQRYTGRQTDRQTGRQTNSAENKGPSGLQSDQKTPRSALVHHQSVNQATFSGASVKHTAAGITVTHARRHDKTHCITNNAPQRL